MKYAEAKKWADKVAAEFNDPLAPKTLTALFRENRNALEELRNTGVTWPKISWLLTEAGIAKKSGQPIPPSQLRATYSAAMNVEKNNQTQCIASKNPKRPVRISWSSDVHSNKPTNRETQEFKRIQKLRRSVD